MYTETINRINELMKAVGMFSHLNGIRFLVRFKKKSFVFSQRSGGCSNNDFIIRFFNLRIKLFLKSRTRYKTKD